jgi:alkanesulfonate monooxygenase SsuD/methylene tetrahydromethanopterin reductase-like flavin-dependent oxidoreductase (luciferase family)
MKIGLFDHVDKSDRSFATQLDERLQLVQLADEAGFYCYHVAEHHASPLNMVPAPAAYMGAVARLTKRIHIGPLVYLLPLYSPLRLAEEICILDHLSKGRFEIGVGRGVSPFELGYHKIDHSKSREIFIDAWKCIDTALRNDQFTYEGPYYNYKDVPMPLRPLQQPTPAYWYGSSNMEGATWAGQQGMHFSSNGPTAQAKGNIAAFREALAKRGGPAHPKAEFSGDTAIGISRQVIVADTDELAREIARPAVAHYHANLTYLLRVHANNDFVKRLNIPASPDLDENIRNGTVIAGRPETVLNMIGEQQQALGINYLIAYMMFGTMTLPQALRSMELFRGEVMPKVEAL